MASVRVGDQRQSTRTGGVPSAIAAMAGFALSAFLIATLAGRSGWLLTLLISRIGVAITLVITLLIIPSLATKARLAMADEQRSMTLAAAAGAGACNLGGTALYAHSGELGLVAIVSAVSALFPLVPIIGGLLMFHERLKTVQIAGITIVVTGLVLLRPA